MIHLRSGLSAGINFQPASKTKEVVEEEVNNETSSSTENTTEEPTVAKAAAYGDLSSEQYLANMGIKMVSAVRVNINDGKVESVDEPVETKENDQLGSLNSEALVNPELITEKGSNNKMPEEENDTMGLRAWFRDKIAQPVHDFVQKHKAIFKLGEEIADGVGLSGVVKIIKGFANAVGRWAGVQ